MLALVASWCIDHAERISKTRLGGLVADAPASVAHSFFGFTAALADNMGPGWPSSAEVRASPITRDPRHVPLPVTRPGLVRFRARSLSGVGARADVLCELLARQGTWTQISDLTRAGYARRTITKVLADFDEAELAVTEAAGRSRRFRLAHRTQLLELLGAAELIWPNWPDILGFVCDLMALDSMRDAPRGARRVAGHQFAERWRHLSPPDSPQTKANPDAYQLSMTWGTEVLRSLAKVGVPQTDVGAVVASSNDAGSLVWVALDSHVADFARYHQRLSHPDVPGVTSVPQPTTPGWAGFLLADRRPTPNPLGLVEHLVWPLKVAWRSPPAHPDEQWPM